MDTAKKQEGKTFESRYDILPYKIFPSVKYDAERNESWVEGCLRGDGIYIAVAEPKNIENSVFMGSFRDCQKAKILVKGCDPKDFEKNPWDVLLGDVKNLLLETAEQAETLFFDSREKLLAKKALQKFDGNTSFALYSPDKWEAYLVPFDSHENAEKWIDHSSVYSKKECEELLAKNSDIKILPILIKDFVTP
jgi:hypothetical protein